MEDSLAFYLGNPCLHKSGMDQFYWNRTFQSHCLEAVLLHQYFVADNVGCPFLGIHALLELALHCLVLNDYYCHAEDSYCPHWLSLAIYHHHEACAKLEG